MKPEPYPHPAENIQLIETHISWVILTGEYAYKIKKPLKLSFLDFSTLALRKYYCDEELRLNRRFAPDLYLEVVGIYGSVARPSLHDCHADRDEPFEYAVKMRQFDPEQRLDELINDGRLTERDIDALAHSIAELHQSSAIYFDQFHGGDPDDHCGDPKQVIEPALDNFKEILDHPPPGTPMQKEALVERWTIEQSSLLGETFRQRRAEGKIRACHGDLHLANLYKHKEKIQAFDCIEFNPDWRHIDVINETGFLYMDMLAKGHDHYAWRFLNVYLERTGDYQGLHLLRYYAVYRAMVRAKTTALRLHENLPEAEAASLLQQYQAYIDLAYRFTRKLQPALIIMCGLSGSGKSTVASQLMAELPAIRLRSDSERKRIQNVSSATHSITAVSHGIYTPDMTAATYQHLQSTATDIIAAAYPVIIDATCLQRAQRDCFRQLAKRLSIPFTVLYCHTSTTILEQRLIRRQQRAEDVSDAGVAVLRHDLVRTRVLRSPTKPLGRTRERE
jgi:aminoglycoside phosphotransferase family enzyme/adenylate kinase family enzyme